VFSTDVLNYGKALFSTFCTIRRFIARLTRKLQQVDDNSIYSGSSLVMNFAKKQAKLTSLLKTIDE
jgi:hypothetical protein